MVTQYVTLISASCDGLDERVNAYLDEGFELYGTPYIYPAGVDTPRPILCQAMIKVEYRAGGIGGGR